MSRRWLLLCLTLAACAPMDSAPNRGRGSTARLGATFFQGSWNASVKVSDTSSATAGCADSNSWESDDGTALADALSATDQNLLVVNLKDDTSGSQCWTTNVDEVLAGIDADANLSASEFALAGAYNDNLSVAEYGAGVEVLRARAASYPELTAAMVIDDFHQYLASPHGTGTRTVADVSAIYAYAHDTANTDPEIAFTPYVSPLALASNVLPSVVLGVRKDDTDASKVYGDGSVASCGGDRFYVEGTFEPGVVAAGETFTIQFLYTDIYNETPDGAGRTLDLSVGVDPADGGLSYADVSTISDLPGIVGDELEYSVALYDSQAFALSSETTATFQIALAPPAGVIIPKGHDKIAYLWDFTILRNTAGVSSPDAADDAVDDWVFVAERDTSCLAAATGLTTAELEAPLIAQSNHDYRVDDYIDGVLFKWGASSEYYDEDWEKDGFEQTVRSTCGAMHRNDKNCFVVFWSIEGDWEYDNETAIVDLSQKASKMDVVSRFADGMIYWLFPNDLDDPTGSVFSNRDPFDAGYEVMGYYPGFHHGIPGYYQSWTGTAPCTGTATVDWVDNGDSSDTTPFKKRISSYWGGVEVDHLDISLGDDDTAGSVSFSVTESEPIVLRFEGTGSVSAYDWYVEYNTTVACDDGGTLSVGEFAYRSGVDPGVEALYDCVVGYYGGDRGSCLH